MREIRFKAWHRTKKYMTPSFPLYKVNLFADPDASEWEMLEYTGLKDKNGVEIYEGDILQTLDLAYVEPKKRKDIVMWDAEKSGFLPFVEYETPDSDGWFPGSYYNTGQCEVIGNIYESPELIKQTK